MLLDTALFFLGFFRRGDDIQYNLSSWDSYFCWT